MAEYRARVAAAAERGALPAAGALSGGMPSGELQTAASSDEDAYEVRARSVRAWGRPACFVPCVCCTVKPPEVRLSRVPLICHCTSKAGGAEQASLLSGLAQGYGKRGWCIELPTPNSCRWSWMRTS